VFLGCKRIGSLYHCKSRKLTYVILELYILQATGPQLGLLFAGVVTIIGGLIVSITASWRLALLMMAFIPLLVGCGMFMNAFFGATKDSAANSGGKVGLKIIFRVYVGRLTVSAWVRLFKARLASP
jgi:ABC-type multidrug transport system fused ATPase/permease subunit